MLFRYKHTYEGLKIEDNLIISPLMKALRTIVNLLAYILVLLPIQIGVVQNAAQ